MRRIELPGPRLPRGDWGRGVYNRTGREAVAAAVCTGPLMLAFGWALVWTFPLFFALAYLLSCALWPGRACGRCRRDKVLDDGRGNIRPRNCNKCQNEGFRLRWGARLLGRTREDLQRKKY